MTDWQLPADIKSLIPDAAARRRMSRIVKSAVATAVACAGGMEGVGRLDAIITATGLGCLADSERFLRNMIADNEQLLNPTPFIQSTFNTAGSQIAMPCRNHCYNVTYVNRSRGFEDALLDAAMRMADGESRAALVGAYDERTPSQYRIMERMGFWRKGACCEGAAFVLLAAERSAQSVAEVARIDFPAGRLTADECLDRYATDGEAELMTGDAENFGLYPIVSAGAFVDAVRKISDGAKEVVVYNEHDGSLPTVMVLKCIGR